MARRSIVFERGCGSSDPYCLQDLLSNHKHISPLRHALRIPVRVLYLFRFSFIRKFSHVLTHTATYPLQYTYINKSDESSAPMDKNRVGKTKEDAAAKKNAVRNI